MRLSQSNENKNGNESCKISNSVNLTFRQLEVNWSLGGLRSCMVSWWPCSPDWHDWGCSESSWQFDYTRCYALKECSSSSAHTSSMTSGVKVACSTSRTLCSCCLLFSCSCLLYTDVRGLRRFDWAHGLNTVTSTNAFSKRPPPKPYMAISRQAPSSVLAELCDMISPVSGVVQLSLHDIFLRVGKLWCHAPHCA